VSTQSKQLSTLDGEGKNKQKKKSPGAASILDDKTTSFRRKASCLGPYPACSGLPLSLNQKGHDGLHPAGILQ
jgi:hypothetical protein